MKAFVWLLVLAVVGLSSAYCLAAGEKEQKAPKEPSVCKCAHPEATTKLPADTNITSISTGSLLPQKVHRAGVITDGANNVRVLDKKDIQTSGANNVQDLLRKRGMTP